MTQAVVCCRPKEDMIWAIQKRKIPKKGDGCEDDEGDGCEDDEGDDGEDNDI